MNFRNDLLLKAARGEKTERTPVWLMRQAGRILPEYRAIRASLSGFKELVETPELACEVTLQPVDILGVDAAIIFSDILVIPDAMGLPYEVIPGQGPHFERTIKSEHDIAALKIANPDEDLHYVLEAIRLTKSELNGRVPLIGFCGAPWTILCYMLEGSGSKTFSKARRFLIQQPELAHQLLTKITESSIKYLKAQIEAGADLVQIFDSWAGILDKETYKNFGLKYISQMCDAINETPVTVFAKGAYHSLEEIANTSCEVVGLDWLMTPEESRQIVGPNCTLQGNLDPAVLYADNKTIRFKTKEMLARFGDHRHIANLGHGVYPDTNPDKVRVFIDTIKEFKYASI